MTRMILSQALAALALGLAGCGTLEPTLPEPQPDVAARWPIPETTPADARREGTPVAAVADVGWRDFLVDSRLQALVARALENNRDLRVAVLNVERARALYRVQRSERLPTVGADA